MQKCTAKGFTPLITPDLVRDCVLEKCGFQPRMDNTQTYSVANSDLCLTGTAEVPLGGIYMDKVVEEKELPIKMVGFGHCFRTEAGAGGTAGKGLYRVHQFSKVEMFVVATPEQSDRILAELLDIEVRCSLVLAPRNCRSEPLVRDCIVSLWLGHGMFLPSSRMQLECGYSAERCRENGRNDDECIALVCASLRC